MSYVAEIQIKIRDLAALAAACRRIDAEFCEGQTTFAWYGRFVGDSTPPAGRNPRDYGQCTHAIRVPCARYEVGVVQALDGDGWDLLWDSYDAGGLAGKLGAKAERLVQAYGVEAARAEALRSGWACTEERQPDGTVLLHVNAGA